MESWRRRRAWAADPRSRRSSRPTSFVFITTSHNSGQFVQKNLESIAMQQYPAFRIQYVDDACTDDTLAQLVDFRARHPRLDMTILRNNERMGPAYSRWRACAAARDHEVCVFLDGDDTLLHPRVLAVLDRVYRRRPGLGATFGSMAANEWQYSRWGVYNRRAGGLFYPHLRTARAVFAKAVPPEYLKDERGDWFMVCTDVALFTAIVERIGTPRGYSFIREPLVDYNRFNDRTNKMDGWSGQGAEGKMRRERYKRRIYLELEPLPPLPVDLLRNIVHAH